MICPKCHRQDVKVVDSRPMSRNRRRRRYLCHNCGHRITTYEMEEEEYSFIKKVAAKTVEIEENIGHLYKITYELKQKVRKIYELEDDD